MGFVFVTSCTIQNMILVTSVKIKIYRRTVSTLAGPNNNGIGSGKAPVRATVSSGPSLMSAPASGRTSTNRNLFNNIHNAVLEEEEPSSPRLPLSCNGNGTKPMAHDTKKEESKLEYLNLKV